MREININRQLLGIEDLLFGFGKVTQIRAGQSIDITKINAGNLPFDETQSLIQWAQNTNLAELGAMTVELQAIYDSIDALNNLENNLVALNTLEQAINCLNNLCSNLTKLQNIDTNMTKLQNIDTNMTKLQNIDTNMTKLQNIDTNILQLSSIYTNMASLQNIYTNMSSLLDINSQIIPHLSEILLVDDYAGQVALDKTTVANDKASVAAMKLAVETIYDTFDDRFLGTKTSDPTLDNDGNPLIDGAMYFNTSVNVLKVYDLGNTTWYAIPQIYLSGLLDVTLTSITTGDILTWNGSKWINTRTPSFDSIKLNGGTGTNGTTTWNNTEYTYDIVLNPNVTLQVGQEDLVYCKNNSASVIANGRPVMASGTNGNSGNILVDLHDGTKANARRIVGIATEDLTANGYGFVTKNGKIRGINTTGSQYGETWANGDILYVKATGNLTKVEPADTELKMPIAFVIHAHTHGTLYVRTTGIDENHDKDFINNLVDIHSKTEKTTLVDEDEFMTADSTSTFSLKKITWASIKTLLANLFIPKVTSTDKAIVRFNGTTGDVQNSGIRIDDAGNILINKPLGGVTMVSMTNGAGDTNLVLPESGTVATTADINSISLSGVTAYHLLQGNLAVSASTTTQGFNTTLYTGNGSTQSINTGIDMDTQWGTTAEEKFGGLVWLKGRSNASNHRLFDTVRGVQNTIQTSSTDGQSTLTTGLSAFLSTGFTTGSYADSNTNTHTYASWNFQTTHRITGTTNHGTPYTCHYNPYTGFTIIKYEGSGTAGHEIPHHLGRKLGFWQTKNLTDGTAQWNGSYFSSSRSLDTFINAGSESNNTTLSFNKTSAQEAYGMDKQTNTSANQYILYGWANSYFDEANKLIGNYEVGVYQGTGASGNKVYTRGKPAWVMSKRLDSTSDWWLLDNKRANDGYLLYPNYSNAEYTITDFCDFSSDGFIWKDGNGSSNASGGQYLYMVAYDTNANGGGTYYPLASDTANVQVNNALIPIAQGIDSNGAKNTILSKNETITGLTYTQGKNYLYKTDTGYGVKAYEPRYLASELVRRFAGEQPDYYDVESNKWFNCDAGAELVTNGTFSSGVTTGWTNNIGHTQIIENGKLKVTSISAAMGQSYQNITTIIGKKYKVRFAVNNVSMASYGLYIDDVMVKNTNGAFSGIVEHTFTANATTSKIGLITNPSATGQVIYFDTVTCFAYDITPTTEIAESRNYLNHIVHADADGGVLYVEELPKIEYKNIIKADEYLGSQIIIGRARINPATTPPTIIDYDENINGIIKGVVRTATGVCEVYIDNQDNNSYSVMCSTVGGASSGADTFTNSKFKVYTVGISPYGLSNAEFTVTIFGGKN